MRQNRCAKWFVHCFAGIGSWGETVFMAAGDVAAFQKVAERKGCVRSTGQRSKLNVESLGGKK